MMQFGGMGRPMRQPMGQLPQMGQMPPMQMMPGGGATGAPLQPGQMPSFQQHDPQQNGFQMPQMGLGGQMMQRFMPQLQGFMGHFPQGFGFGQLPQFQR